MKSFTSVNTVRGHTSEIIENAMGRANQGMLPYDIPLVGRAL
jgi:hypothetical protein